MQLAHPDLRTLLDRLLSGGAPTERAYAENIRLEERVGADRERGYVTDLPALLPDAGAWTKAHNERVARLVNVELPETFTACNRGAALSAEVDGTLHLIRVERIDWALEETGLDADRLAVAADILHGRREDATMTIDDARELAEDLCDSFNTNPVRGRPKFAGLFQDLRSESIDPPSGGGRTGCATASDWRTTTRPAARPSRSPCFAIRSRTCSTRFPRQPGPPTA